MYERFTDRARKVMSLSNVSAHRIGSEFVRPEHILAGILAEGGGVASQAIRNIVKPGMVLTPDLVEGTIGAASPVGDPGEKRPLTEEAKAAINKAKNTAKQWNSSFIGTEHLLIGLISVESGVLKILSDVGIAACGIEKEIIRICSERQINKGVEHSAWSVFQPCLSASPASGINGDPAERVDTDPASQDASGAIGYLFKSTRLHHEYAQPIDLPFSVVIREFLKGNTALLSGEIEKAGGVNVGIGISSSKEHGKSFTISFTLPSEK